MDTTQTGKGFGTILPLLRYEIKRCHRFVNYSKTYSTDAALDRYLHHIQPNQT